MSLQTATHQPTPHFSSSSKPSVGVGMWTEEEHARFLEGVKLFSSGPWKRVAAYVGTRNVRQTMTHAQKYRLKAARRLREAQRKQAAARHSLHSAHRGIVTPDNAALAQRSLHSPSAGGLGLGSYSKMRLPCSCTEKDCPHMDDASKVYMSIADAIEILDSKSTISVSCSPVSPDDTIGSTWLTAGGDFDYDAVVKMQAFGGDDLVPLDSAASDSDEFPTLEDCASELLELLF
ncbi:Myb-like DNA-binding protein [Phytophthora cinnamomi]|uniref:Myb-like DNA-binding protein n=1 Tax=Phytophthora cinnamomi TaxID=4785 RepID=UPI00355A19CF|nr:Myb-like DNA-binding protein [Phytophthora cinnamomi]